MATMAIGEDREHEEPEGPVGIRITPCCDPEVEPEQVRTGDRDPADSVAERGALEHQLLDRGGEGERRDRERHPPDPHRGQPGEDAESPCDRDRDEGRDREPPAQLVAELGGEEAGGSGDGQLRERDLAHQPRDDDEGEAHDGAHHRDDEAESPRARRDEQGDGADHHDDQGREPGPACLGRVLESSVEDRAPRRERRTPDREQHEDHEEGNALLQPAPGDPTGQPGARGREPEDPRLRHADREPAGRRQHEAAESAGQGRREGGDDEQQGRARVETRDRCGEDHGDACEHRPEHPVCRGDHVGGAADEHRALLRLRGGAGREPEDGVPVEQREREGQADRECGQREPVREHDDAQHPDRAGRQDRLDRERGRAAGVEAQVHDRLEVQQQAQGRHRPPERRRLAERPEDQPVHEQPEHGAEREADDERGGDRRDVDDVHARRESEDREHEVAALAQLVERETRRTSPSPRGRS